MSIPDKIQVVIGCGDWGMSISHLILPEDAEFYSRYDRDVLLAEIPSMQPYCMGETSKNEEYAKSRWEFAEELVKRYNSYKEPE